MCFCSFGFFAAGVALGVFGVVGLGDLTAVSLLAGLVDGLVDGLGVRVLLRFFKCIPEGPASGESMFTALGR